MSRPMRPYSARWGDQVPAQHLLYIRTPPGGDASTAGPAPARLSRAHASTAQPGARRARRPGPASAGPQPGAPVADPQADQAAQVRDELVVLASRVDRPDRLDQQLVEVGTGHPVQHELVDARDPARAEVLVTL